MAALPRRAYAGIEPVWLTGPWIRTTDLARFTAGRRLPLATASDTNGRVGRTRTSTRLRPRQVGYRLPYDPKNELG